MDLHLEVLSIAPEEAADFLIVGHCREVHLHAPFKRFSDVMRASFENAKRLYRNKLRPLLEEDDKVSLEHDRPRMA